MLSILRASVLPLCTSGPMGQAPIPLQVIGMIWQKNTLPNQTSVKFVLPVLLHCLTWPCTMRLWVVGKRSISILIPGRHNWILLFAQEQVFQTFQLTHQGTQHFPPQQQQYFLTCFLPMQNISTMRPQKLHSLGCMVLFTIARIAIKDWRMVGR